MHSFIARHLQALWWSPRPTGLAWLLWPLTWPYRTLFAIAQWRARRLVTPLPVPLVVVGNLIVGGAGKTPTVVALVRALRVAGWHPGVVSRGYGRSPSLPRALAPGSSAQDVGDEPALIARLTGAPVWVGTQRADVARRLCAAHPEVNILVSDDGLQHAALPRQLEVLVFDERGVGNGLLLPAGPLREPMWPSLTPKASVLYNATAPTTALPGHLVQRRLGHAVPLPDWAVGHIAAGRPLGDFGRRRCLAAAGIAAPERFFAMLEAAGLQITRLPLPDHHDFAEAPWGDDAGDVFITEKDAIKLMQLAATPSRVQVWVVGLDFVLPDAFLRWLIDGLARHRTLPAP